MNHNSHSSQYSKTPVLLIMIILFSSCHSQLVRTDNNKPDFSLTKEMTAYKNYVAPFTKQDIVIDGKAHEAIWDSISFTSNFVDIKS
ncbi:MAG: hypothetical protein HKO66_03190, partial [Saprospiraceae bacterium]|nr:hypothetical protein [Bacteroidia bacterium]NNL91219.1 hypothetical protein [Saprospiraceae bacterium]